MVLQLSHTWISLSAVFGSGVIVSEVAALVFLGCTWISLAAVSEFGVIVSEDDMLVFVIASGLDFNPRFFEMRLKNDCLVTEFPFEAED